MTFNFDPETRHKIFHLIEDTLNIIKMEKEKLRTDDESESSASQS